jgi:alcohol dehydrogenase (cytochrome c)
LAQSQQDLIKGSANTDNVVNYGMGYNQHRYSTLTQINKGNAKRIVPVWSLSLESELGEQAQPMVYDGVMYVANSKFTVAIEAASGKVLWRTPVNFDPATPRVVC